MNDQVRPQLDLLLRHAPREVLAAAVRERSVECLAQSLGLEVTTEELQAAADAFRLDKRLLTYEQTREWLDERWLTDASWKQLLRSRVLLDKLTRRWAAAADTEFNTRRGDFDRMLGAQLIVEEEGLAYELYLLVVEEGHSFDVLARRYSVEHAHRGMQPVGTLRKYFRCELPTEVAAAAFAADAAMPVMMKPINHAGQWRLYRAYCTYDAVLDDETRALIAHRSLERELCRFESDVWSQLRAIAGR